MSFAVPPRNARPRPRRWFVAAIVLLLTAAGCLGLGLRGHQDALAGPPGPQFNPLTSPEPTGSGPTGKTGVSAARSEPVELRIPAIGVAVTLSEIGLNPDGTVQVPTDFQQPGWYRLGPSPGQLGSAVILGHVDSYLGPAVFFRLRSLRAGNAVEVRLADGVIAHFVVSGVAMYPKAHFPDQLVYGSHGYSELQLVTCGGIFDNQTRHYLSNIVVYTHLVAITPAPSVNRE
ncbi:MAG: class F sortase [Streptosporangiaceae bacterium]|jgi:sortase (surface protein transpeptidase)